MRLRRPGPDSPRSGMPLGLNVVVVLAVAVLLAAGAALLIWLALGRPPVWQVSGWTTANSFEFAKIVLALIGGVGAVVALVVAYRKQHLGEAAERREDIKLFAERFTKAADQLGSDKAPVRLAGMYALEDLAQGTPSQRQTIVNVLCAYLRMPYLAPDTAVEQEENERRQQEKQVRLTAQRILAAHLRPGDGSTPASTFWRGVDLDLTGATLLDVDFTGCHFGSVRFNEAEFSGSALFHEAEFNGRAWFSGVRFGRNATFERARFHRSVWFFSGNFAGSAGFAGVKFLDSVSFAKAEFSGAAVFSKAEFNAYVMFNQAKFGQRVEFGVEQFESPAVIEGAQVRDEATGEWVGLTIS
ncbi:pentapeptide repeat-containing protein [Lentzea sp. CA-135723]|uniref:pentapeptide repeat-containing protein n=1 Tax=Lentzea sp. CA-135723 TaxID=3239950 RepID=UPI003D8C4845